MDSTSLFIFILYSTAVISSLLFTSRELDTKKVVPIIIEEIQEETPIEIETIEEEPKQKYLGEYKITYYCACMKCCGKTNGITASGEKVKAGVTVAAPKDFPFGTKLLINGNTYIVIISKRRISVNGSDERYDYR
jgi:3D (Asp-Asp-Asp) domain-containing protein